jgi:hypothetical protein
MPTPPARTRSWSRVDRLGKHRPSRGNSVASLLGSTLRFRCLLNRKGDEVDGREVGRVGNMISFLRNQANLHGLDSTESSTQDDPSTNVGNIDGHRKSTDASRRSKWLDSKYLCRSHDMTLLFTSLTHLLRLHSPVRPRFSILVASSQSRLPVFLCSLSFAFFFRAFSSSLVLAGSS